MCKNPVLKNLKSLKNNYYVVFTVLFGVTTLFVFSWFILADRTFIWKNDGWNQHYKALVYFAKYLRSIAKNLIFEHSLIIPNWDFSFGEGNDILGTLHYYVIGDPFNVLSVLVPTKYLSYYYDFMIMLRIYFAGIAFSMLCFETGKHSKIAVLSGALSYAFCYWAIFNVCRHPYFLNPLIYFPLLILGVEKILKNKRPYMFIVAVFLAAVSNFYFFYMLAILTALYAIIRLIFIYKKEIKKIFAFLLKLASSAIVGVLMSAVILLPMIYIFLSDSRLSSGYTVDLFYPLSYYSALPALFLGNKSPSWVCLGLSGPSIAALFLLFIKKKSNNFLKTILILCFIMLLFPIFAHVLNGFSYSANRWSFAIVLPICYTLTTMWPSFAQLKKREMRTLSICMTAYFVICILAEYSRSINNVFSSFCIMLLFVLCMVGASFSKEVTLKPNMTKYLALFMIVMSVINNGFWRFSLSGTDYAAQAVGRDDARDKLYSNEVSAVLSAAEKDLQTDFYRFSGQNLTLNANALNGVSSTQYFWSISNPHTAKLRALIASNQDIVYHYQNYDNMSGLFALSSVKYYTTKPEQSFPIPYGFEETVTDSKTYSVYKNTNYLPLAYTYDSYMSEDDWLKLPYIDRQEALLQCAVVPSPSKTTQKATPLFDNQNIEYTMSFGSDDISLQQNSFVVTSKNAYITLDFNGKSNSETYLIFKGLKFKGNSKYDLYFGDESVDPLNKYDEVSFEELSHSTKEKLEKDDIFYNEPSDITLKLKSDLGCKNSIAIRNNESILYNQREDFAVNLGYYRNETTSVTITFPEIGTYSFDSIEINCLPMDNLSKRVDKLKDNGIENTKVSTDKVECHIDVKEPQIVCFAIPYSTGWKAYVDGKETELTQTNIQHMSLELDSGQHDIQLVYKTPFLNIGLVISCLGFLALITLIIVFERKKKLLSAANAIKE